jgi:hypothetical protein
MLRWSFSEEAAAEKYMAQGRHNIWVTYLRSAVLSIITGGGKWVETTIPMDPLSQCPGVRGKEILALRDNPVSLPTSSTLSHRDLAARRSASST